MPISSVPGTAGTEMKRALRFREETTAMHDAIKFCTLHAVRFVGSGRPSSDVFLIIGRAIVSVRG